jgi:plasmid stabilization system protein ParE
LRRTVVLSIHARADIERLIEFLEARNPGAALQARVLLQAALDTLDELPARGRLVSAQHMDIRELPVTFGRYGYAVRYQIREHEVLVTRIFHLLEDR